MWISEGLSRPRRGALSRHWRKYGSWSIAQGMRQGIRNVFLGSLPKMKGKEVAKAVADCVAGNANSNILLLLEENQTRTRYETEKKRVYLRIVESKGTFDLVVCCFLAHF